MIQSYASIKMDMQSNEDTGKNVINGHLQNTQHGKDNTAQLEEDFNNCSFRSLDRRSSIENFGLFGLLTPLLALVPHVNGVSGIFRNLIALTLFLFHKLQKKLLSTTSIISLYLIIKGILIH